MNDDELASLLRAVRFTEPPRDQIEEMRTAVLASRSSRRSPTIPARRWLGLTLGLAAAAIAIVVLTRESPPADHGTVMAEGDTRFTHSTAPDEIVRFSDGTLVLEVSPLPAGSRFRVITGTDEVEVKGTRFEVSARGDRLTRVAVEHGRVEVRSQGRFVVLSDGEQWEAPRIVTREAIPPVTRPAPIDPPPIHVKTPPVRVQAPLTRRMGPAVIGPAPKAAPTPSASELAFQRGWHALRDNDPTRAAVDFESALQLSPTGELAEDATFWRSVAWSRAGRRDLARDGFAAFLASFPRSVRASEAALLLGETLLEAGDLDRAERWLRQAREAQVVRIRTRAEVGLAELARRRTTPR